MLLIFIVLLLVTYFVYNSLPSGQMTGVLSAFLPLGTMLVFDILLLLIIFLSIYRFLFPKFLFRISKNGIIDNSVFSGVGLIPWSEISEIKVQSYRYAKYLVFDIKNPYWLSQQRGLLKSRIFNLVFDFMTNILLRQKTRLKTKEQFFDPTRQVYYLLPTLDKTLSDIKKTIKGFNPSYEI
ncbi:STM3941 family protein [Patescibacteria group bacterium]